MRSIEDSLRQLGLNRIDTALIHDIDTWTHNEPAETETKYKNEDSLVRVREIEEVCQQHGVLHAAALQFPRAHSAAAAVIPDARNIAELTENATLITAPIPTEFWQELKGRRLILEKVPFAS